MRVLRAALFLVACGSASFGVSQTTEHTLSGTLRDGENGETLIGASVYSPESGRGTTSNAYGFYSIDLPAVDSLTVIVSYVGFEPRAQRLFLTADRRLDVELGGGLELEEVVVRAEGLRNRVRSTQMSVEKVGARQAKLIPALLGESDILKTIQLKPGIPSGSEGTTGIFVRGGGSDQNLILLDEAVVYNANHLFGFFSTFNTDAVKDLRLYKGGFPAEYGGRLSSVIDVKLKDGNSKRFSGSGGLGLVASRLTLEGPIAEEERGSFIVSGRRTYVDLLTNAANEINEDKPEYNPIPAYNFYDLNAKVNYKLSERDRIFLSGYFGRDKFAFSDDTFTFGFDWGNATGTARWNHLFTPRLFANTTATFSDYQYNIRNRITGFNFALGSKVQDINLKSDFYYNLADKQTIHFGGGITYHRFQIGKLDAGSDDGRISYSAGNELDGFEYALYANDEFELGDRTRLNVGLRGSGWSNDDTLYVRAEPRAAVNYQGDEAGTWSLKASYARMNQYVHLVSASGVSLPTDIWYPSTRRVKPQASDQVAFGGTYLLDEELLVTSEVYYKWLRNQVDFVDGANLFVNDSLEEEFDFGRGHAYGFEVQLEKTEGKLTGWIGYTWQKTRRGDFANIMQGRYFSPRFDRRHDISVVGIYELNRRLTLTATWVYGSGDLAWIPIGRTVVKGTPGADFQSVVPVYGDRNNYRLRAYHRGDAGVVIKLFPKWGESDLTVSVFNLYDRRNAFFVYIDPEFSDLETLNGSIEVPTGVSPKQVSLFPVLPSVTWNFSF